MKLDFHFNQNIIRIFALFFILIFLSFGCNLNKVNALEMNNEQNGTVFEELRLKIPSEFKDTWVQAEKTVWEPWLSKQDGFLGRQIFWNKEKEEALILVNWKSKKLWKNISIAEVNEVQKKFEESVKSALKIRENPFKLIYEGELGKQG